MGPPEPQPKPSATSLMAPLHKLSQSTLFGVSMRGWLAMVLTSTMCALALLGKPIDEKLFALVSMAIGFYFGQKNTEQPAGGGDPFGTVQLKAQYHSEQKP